MFSEIHAEQTTKTLEKVLLKGIKSGNSEILEFLGNDLYPIYLLEASECGTYNIPQEIKNAYSRFVSSGTS